MFRYKFSETIRDAVRSSSKDILPTPSVLPYACAEQNLRIRDRYLNRTRICQTRPSLKRLFIFGRASRYQKNCLMRNYVFFSPSFVQTTLCFVCFPLRSPFSHEERFQSTVVTDDQFLRETRAIHARLS